MYIPCRLEYRRINAVPFPEAPQHDASLLFPFQEQFRLDIRDPSQGRISPHRKTGDPRSEDRIRVTRRLQDFDLPYRLQGRLHS